MQRLLLLSAFCILALTACKKEVATAKVTYTVHEVSAASPAMFSVEYTGTSGTVATTSSSEDWDSGILQLEQGKTVIMKVSCNEPSYQYSLSIFVNGNLWKTGTLSSPNGEVTISGEIPGD